MNLLHFLSIRFFLFLFVLLFIQLLLTLIRIGLDRLNLFLLIIILLLCKVNELRARRWRGTPYCVESRVGVPMGHPKRRCHR